MTKVLIALDGSMASRGAVEAVKGMIGAGTSVVLFSVLPVPPETAQSVTNWIPWRWPGGPPATPLVQMVETRAQAMDRIRNETLDRLESAGKELRESGAQVTSEMAFGEPVPEILNEAERQQVDMIVVASHGRTGIRATLLGSVASALIRARKRPVLVAVAHEDKE